LQVGDEVLHIELTKWADMLVIAPLSARYLAKLANGLCDDLLTSVVRAWPSSKESRKPLLLAPCLHNLIWAHPVTPTQVAMLSEWRPCRFVLPDGECSGTISPEQCAKFGKLDAADIMQTRRVVDAAVQLTRFA
jgi:phosphopantothenoylcysteine synthetase/decarboxylase